MDRAKDDTRMTPGKVGRRFGAVPIVLVHGFTGSAESWGGPLRSHLAESGRPVVAVEVPGHGASALDTGPHPFTLDDALESIGSGTRGPVDLVGYSMGGRIALHFAVRHPERVRRLVLESASPGLATERERADRRADDERLAARIEEDGVLAFVAEWSDRGVLRPAADRPPHVRERTRRIRLGNRAAGLAGALRGLGTGALPSLWDRLPDVRAPTLLLVGAADAKFVDIARRMAEDLPDGTVTIVPEAGHTVHLDRPDAWIAAVQRHLGER
ncbi:MAG: 2-succinyl-6-hydroxy-2,4-cyclohexadiene-1-carboxylate synthase [Gemmatimonadota bacterium]